MKPERETIRHFIEQDDPDVVSAHWTYEYALGALASDKPTIITVRDWAPTILRYDLTPYRLGRLCMQFDCLLRAQHIVVNSLHIGQNVQRFLRKHVTVIPNSLGDSLFVKGVREPRLTAPTIVSANNGFGRLKNVKNLLLAFRLIREKLPACRLSLLGCDFEENGPAQQWAIKHGLDHGVHFVGYLDRLSCVKFIQASDLLIHPAYEESFGLSVLEAMASGTPVVGGRESGAVPWLLDQGRAGILADVRSPRDIADNSLDILTSATMWNGFSLAARHYAWENFRTAQSVNRYLAMYNRALAQPQN